MKIVNLIIRTAAGLILFQTTCVYEFDVYRSVPSAARLPSQVLLAEKSGEPSTNQPAEDKKDTAKTPKTDQRDSGKSGPIPLKPFIPSEKIKADQEVDFPYDI